MKILILIGILGSFDVFAEINRTYAPVYMEVGEQRAISVDDLAQFSVAGSGVRYVHLHHPQKILLKAVKEGRSELFVRTKSQGSFQRPIIVARPTKTSANLVQALTRIESTEIIDVGDAYWIHGPVRSVLDAKYISLAMERFPKQIIEETTIDPVLFGRLSGEIHRALAGYSKVAVSLERDQVRVSGSFPNQETALRKRAEVQRIWPLVRWDVSAFKEQGQVVFFKVFLLELSQEAGRAMGVDWSKQLNSQFSVIPFHYLSTDPLDLTLNALETSGKLRILSAPEMVIRAPGEAELFSGGQIPFQTLDRRGTSVQWKDFGLKVKLNVSEIADPMLRLSISAESSHLDQNLSKNEMPGLRDSRIKTQVDATFSEPIFLSGLVADSNRNARGGLPFLSAIPILGGLFGRNGNESEKREVAAVLIPYRNPPTHPMNRVLANIPRGPLPLPRNWISSQDESDMRASRDWPWNAFSGDGLAGGPDGSN